jgi:hypothetical protein
MLSLKLEQTYENILYHFQNMLSQIWEKVSVNLKPTDRKMLVLGIQNPPELSSEQRVSQREKTQRSSLVIANVTQNQRPPF